MYNLYINEYNQFIRSHHVFQIMLVPITLLFSPSTPSKYKEETKGYMAPGLIMTQVHPFCDLNSLSLRISCSLSSLRRI